MHIDAGGAERADDGKDMIGRPAGDEGSEDERDRLQSLLCAVLCLDLLLLLPTEPDSLPNLVDQVWPLSPR